MPYLLHAANEQSDEEVDLDRYVRLACHVLSAEEVSPEAELSLIFVDEPTIAQYHERFLGDPGPTDVMAFPIDDDVPAGGRRPDHGDRGPGAAADPSAEPPAMLGDVMVCPAFAAREAREREGTLAEELALLVVHGVLHLLSYDHQDPEEELAMQRRQAELLADFAANEAREDGR
jgi:probable rRNA maturation factor